MTTNGLAGLPAVYLTLVSLGFFAVAGLLNAVETALERLSKATAQDLVDDERRGAEIVLAQVTDRAHTDYSVRSVRLVLQTLATIFLTLVIAAAGWRWWLVALVALGLNWLLLMLFVAVLPRQVSARWPGGTMLALQGLTSFTVKLNDLFAPLAGVVRRLKPEGPQTEAEARYEMADDLREMADQVGEAELFAEEDRQMLRSVFELGQTLVREVMLPRTDMITISEDESLSKALKLFVRSGFSRLPVTGEDADDIRGLVFFKDCARRVLGDPEEAQTPVSAAMRRAHFVPDNMYADDLMRQMQRDSFHMALAVDEWGGIAGLVTLEDLLEEVVGELRDEHDHAEGEPVQLSEDEWEVPARFSVDDLGELFDLELPDEDAATVGGLVASEVNKVPLPGTRIEVKGLEIIAGQTVGRRKQVATYLVRRQNAETERK
ncbi:hypothetical protein BK816_06070 [Boudabousia tangfeifanii]|uniref:CBS domain-containing protein n=1 Tax=Boudabousia tangfeifanii TaxID=1912795 RepID=A0A1D9ML79_9ACTO|nr:hemolysin family protein [Boudabousia tangfeifanii]AOZ72910.1 hypothetical protein BK816_06070 [Boudabousia tangfeifanii]